LRFTTLTVLFFTSFICHSLFAAWETNGPVGGSVEEIVFHPSTPWILIAGTQGGIYKSIDGGATWTKKNFNLIESRFIISVDVDPSNPNTYYAGHYGGVSKSVDGGETWQDLGGPPPGFVDSLLVESSSTLYAGTLGGGIYKSTNGGNGWNPANNGLNNDNVLSLARTPNGTLYAGTSGGGVFKSTNSGGNWSPVNSGLGNRIVSDLAIDPTDSSIIYAATEWGVFKTSNGGSNWTDLQPAEYHYAKSVAIDPANPQIVYVGRIFSAFALGDNTFPGTLTKSTDGGQNWGNVTNNLPDKDVVDMVIIPGSPSSVVAGLFGGGIATSSNGGASWTASSSGMSAFVVNKVVTDPTNAHTIYAASWGGVHRSTDNGLTWAKKDNGLTDGPVAFSIAVNPTSPWIVYTAISTGVFRSLDNGDTWQRITSLGFSDRFVSLQIIPNTNTMYAGSPLTGVWKSTDGGANWAPKNNGLTNTQVREVVFNPNNPDILYAGTFGGGVFKSTNGGNNWDPVNNGIGNKEITAIVINPLDPSNLYTAATAGKVYKTINAGSSWTLKNNGIRYPSDFFCLAIHPLTPNSIYGGVDGGDGVYITFDGGENWDWKRNGLPANHEVYSLAISPGSTPGTDKLHAGTLGDGLYDFDFAVTCSTITISPTTLPDAVAGVPYDVALSASGGDAPYTFSLIAGNLPTGLFLTSDGHISGVSSATPGDYNFTIGVTDSKGCQGNQALTITATGTITLLFNDDFEDGLLTWPVTKGNWQESSGNLTANTPSSAAIVSAPVPWSPSGLSGCINCTFRVTLQTNGGAFSRTFVQAWYLNKSNRVDLVVKEENDKWVLKHISNGQTVAKASVILPIQPGAVYDVMISQFGGTFNVYIDGALRITMNAGAAVPSGNLTLKVKKTVTSFLQAQVY
jgi:photosystem II stability/assembly factor-like uncharacterized protein